jgi:hypothetical protein
MGTLTPSERDEAIAAAKKCAKDMQSWSAVADECFIELRDEWESKGWNWSSSTGFAMRLDARRNERSGVNRHELDNDLIQHSPIWAQIIAEQHPD